MSALRSILLLLSVTQRQRYFLTRIVAGVWPVAVCLRSNSNMHKHATSHPSTMRHIVMYSCQDICLLRLTVWSHDPWCRV
jgi:hypothetical protein